MTPRELADLAVEVWRIGRRLEEASAAADDPYVSEKLFEASDFTTAVTRAMHDAAIRQKARNSMKEGAA